MADEPIGSVSVAITGDYSGLEKSFAQSQNLAQQAGQQIGVALETGAASATNLTTALTGTVDALTGIVRPSADVEAQMQALFEKGMSASEAMAVIHAQAQPAAATVQDLGAASVQAAAGVAQVGQAAQQAAPPLAQAARAIRTTRQPTTSRRP